MNKFVDLVDEIWTDVPCVKGTSLKVAALQAYACGPVGPAEIRRRFPPLGELTDLQLRRVLDAAYLGGWEDGVSIGRICPEEIIEISVDLDEVHRYTYTTPVADDIRQKFRPLLDHWSDEDLEVLLSFPRAGEGEYSADSDFSVLVGPLGEVVVRGSFQPEKAEMISALIHQACNRSQAWWEEVSQWMEDTQ